MVNTENFTPMYNTLCEPYSAFRCRNKTMNSYIVVCTVKCSTEINDASSMNVCKKYWYLPLFSSILL